MHQMPPKSSTSTETVSLTKTQLQAILELITKIGGVGVSESRPIEAWEETKHQNEKISPNDDNLELTSAGIHHRNYLIQQKRIQWERERAEMSSYNNWLDKVKSFDRSLIVSPNQANIMLPQSLSSPDSSPTSNNGSQWSLASNTTAFADPKHRRYARINDSEVDIIELDMRRMKIAQYQRELAAQKREKELRLKAERDKIRREEEMLEKRLKEQQTRMRMEYEIEQKKLREKQELAEQKRAAVIAAIERTPKVKKRHFSNKSEMVEDDIDNVQLLTSPVVATVLPLQTSNDISSQTNDNQDRNKDTRDIGVQTDIQLLLALFNQVKVENGDEKEKVIRKPVVKQQRYKPLQVDSSSSRSSSPAMPSASEMALTIKNKSFQHKPLWGINQPNKFYVKNSDKELPSRMKNLSEIRRKYLERENQNRNKKSPKVNNGDSNANRKLVQNAESNWEKSYEQNRSPRTDSSRSGSHRSSSHSRRHLDKEQDKTNNFLPNINAALRPHSRKKWHSQETFDPILLANE